MQVTIWTTAVAFAVMAGIYFTFSSFVMSSLAALAPSHGVAAMQSINRVIVSSAFMPLFVLTTLASVGLAGWGMLHWRTAGSPTLVAAGLLYFFGMFVCTAAFNVPLNNALDAVDPNTQAAADLWTHYLRSWTRWNHLRTVSCTVASGLLALAS